MKFSKPSFILLGLVTLGASLFFRTTSDVRAFSGAGAGTGGDPYLITTCAQLIEVNDALGAYYELTTDLDCSANGNNIMIGASGTPFTGNFVGNGKIVTVNINLSSNQVGLFRYVSGGTIDALGVAGSVTGQSNVGALAGEINNANIDRIKSLANVTGTVAHTGGIIGEANNSTIDYAYATGNIIGVTSTGGVVGATNFGSISETYFTGSISTTGNNTGGIVGSAVNFTAIQESFAAGIVDSDLTISGGIAGDITDPDLLLNVFDVIKTQQNDCYYNTPPDGFTCDSVNEGDAEPNYFKGNDDNAPLDIWTWDNTYWVIVPDDYPELNVFNGESDTEPPVISNVSVDQSNTSAVITWTTDEAASSQVNYGLYSNVSTATSETDTSPRVTSHTVNVTGLLACTIYYYNVESTDASTNTRTSLTTTFTTEGCAGSAPVLTQLATDLIDVDTGDSVEHTATNHTLTLEIPADFAGQDAYFQIKQLSDAPVIDTYGTPAGKTKIAGHVYSLNAYTDIDSPLASFTEPIEIFMTYEAGDLNGIDPYSLAIHRWNGSAWNELSPCMIDPDLRQISCVTTNFSNFGLFGDAVAQEQTHSQSSSSSNGSNTNSSGHSFCSALPPTGTPDLFQIDRTNSSATLYFTPVDGVNSYHVIFGYNKGDERFGGLSLAVSTDKNNGVQKMQIDHLDSKVAYWFKVVPANGCAIGTWSDWLKTDKVTKWYSIFYKYF